MENNIVNRAIRGELTYSNQTFPISEFIDYFDVLMGQPFSPRTNCAVGSFGDTLSINFTSTIIETDVERYFFRKLVQEGLHVKIETNRDMNRSEF